MELRNPGGAAESNSQTHLCPLQPSPTLPTKCGHPLAAAEDPLLHTSSPSPFLGAAQWETQTPRTFGEVGWARDGRHQGEGMRASCGL